MWCWPQWWRLCSWLISAAHPVTMLVCCFHHLLERLQLGCKCLHTDSGTWMLSQFGVGGVEEMDGCAHLCGESVFNHLPSWEQWCSCSKQLCFIAFNVAFLRYVVIPGDKCQIVWNSFVHLFFVFRYHKGKESTRYFHYFILKTHFCGHKKTSEKQIKGK